MPHELFLPTRQKTNKAQVSKITQSGVSFGSWLDNLDEKAIANVAICFARDKLPGLVSNITSNAINKFESRISAKEVVRAGKGFTLFFRMAIWMILLKS